MSKLINLFNAIAKATQAAREKAVELDSTIKKMKKLKFDVRKADLAKLTAAEKAVDEADKKARLDFDKELLKQVKATATAELPNFFKRLHLAFVSNDTSAVTDTNGRPDYLKESDEPPTFGKVSCRAIAAFALQNGLSVEDARKACQKGDVKIAESLLDPEKPRYMSFPSDNLARENMAAPWKMKTKADIQELFAN